METTVADEIELRFVDQVVIFARVAPYLEPDGFTSYFKSFTLDCGGSVAVRVTWFEARGTWQADTMIGSIGLERIGRSSQEALDNLVETLSELDALLHALVG